MIGVDDTWRSVVRRNVNWRFRRFVKREYVLEDYSPFPVWSSPSLVIAQKLHLENILSKDPVVPKLEVFNVSNEPNMVQTMEDVECFKICGSKLLVYNGSLFRIYTLQQGQYCEIFHSEHEKITLSALSNEFFAFVDSTSRNIRVVDFLKLEDLNWTLPQDQEITSLSICDMVLNIVYVTRLESHYYLERYNLEERTVINNVLLSEHIISSLSEFAVNPLLVVYRVVDYGSDYLFVRKLDGQLDEEQEVCESSEYSIYGISPISEIKNITQKGNQSSTTNDKVVLVIYDFR
ncbi:hypothetical protein J6590_040566 [Homalodisca vitripennis]|nr:hypothetical protein J6590_040566 [Homalodisca vitripennis]